MSVEKEQGLDTSLPREVCIVSLGGVIGTTGAGLSLRSLMREFEPV